jgi:hypothetical protein
MSRRRRRREPAFGSDSFLDVIANLVGIVIILIVMVGAHIRELPMLQTVLAPKAAVEETGTETETAPEDLRQFETQIAGLQEWLLESIRSLDRLRHERQQLTADRQILAAKNAAETGRLSTQEARVSQLQAELAQARQQDPPLQDRIRELQKAVEELQHRPPETRPLRYHLPVSRPVAGGELFFECQAGRVTFLDLEALLSEVKRDLPAKTDILRTTWETTDSAGPVGAFRLHYTVARDRRSTLDRAFGELPPTEVLSYSYGLSRWEAVPVWPERGEKAEEALADDSRFRRLVDACDPDAVTVTFAVYPDSFETFRVLRDYLHERRFVVAGRPLPAGVPIAGSRNGSISLGQ